MTKLGRVAVIAVPLALLAACSEDRKADSSATVRVNATDTECGLANTEATAGSVTFEVTNRGSKVTEFYLYGADNKVVGEVEDIGPGTTRKLTVKVSAGVSYTAACKPGMTGDGIRTGFTVKASAAKARDTEPELAVSAGGYRH